MKVRPTMSTVFGAPGRYVQGAGELERLGEHVSSLGCAAFVILDSGTDDRLGETLGPAFFACEDLVEPCFEVYDGPCTEQAVMRLAQSCEANDYDVVVGIGGGKMLDIAKAVAHFTERPLCVVPTAASTDAPCSALSVLYNEDGSFDRYLHLTRNPDMVVVDTAVVAKAPLSLTVAGMGDALATYFEARSCAAAGGINELGGTSGTMALVAARACYDTLIKYGATAVRDIKRGKVSPAVERVIECNILLSGIGFESGGLALAHAIANGIASLPDRRVMHGQAVAVGLAAQLRLEQTDELDRVLDFCHAVGLPTTLAELGWEDVSDKELKRIATSACACRKNLANERVKIKPKGVIDLLRS